MNFAAETIERLFSKTPWYFRVIKIVGIIVAVITGLPSFLTEAGIVLPEAINAIANQTVAIAASVAVVISQLAKVEPETHPTDIAEKADQIEQKLEEGTI